MTKREENMKTVKVVAICQSEREVSEEAFQKWEIWEMQKDIENIFHNTSDCVNVKIYVDGVLKEDRNRPEKGVKKE